MLSVVVGGRSSILVAIGPFSECWCVCIHLASNRRIPLPDHGTNGPSGRVRAVNAVPNFEMLGVNTLRRERFGFLVVVVPAPFCRITLARFQVFHRESIAVVQFQALVP